MYIQLYSKVGLVEGNTEYKLGSVLSPSLGLSLTQQISDKHTGGQEGTVCPL